MPIKVQGDLPAKKILEDENIFIMDETRALTQDIRPLKIAILNLMPNKEETEVALLRSLSNTPIQVDKRAVPLTWPVGKNEKFDGLIITGAPVEHMEFEEVAYWEELKQIMDWSATNVTSTLHICWGAQASLYHHYGIKKRRLDKKVFGVFEHKVMNRKTLLVRGFDDVFYAPHSRYTSIDKEDVQQHEELTILAESEEAGVFIVIANEGKQIFIMGHPEYDREALDKEYKRDINKGLDIELPKNYYPSNDPSQKPILTWRSHSHALYTNWLNYYVYQVTPYQL